MNIEISGTNLFYEVSGNGPAWVFLHGFLESSTMWKNIIPEFSDSHTIITIDLPGHGKSGVVAETHSMEFFADTVRKVLRHLNITEATFIGHSMGGYVALAYAEMYPEEVRSLVLMNSTPTEDSLDRKQNRARALDILKENPNPFIKLVIANLFSNESQLKFQGEVQKLQEEALHFPLEGIMAAIRGMKDRKDRTSVLKQWNKTKYMICGDQDPIIPLNDSEKWAQYCNSELKIVSGGHMSYIENKSEIVKILHFIE